MVIDSFEKMEVWQKTHALALELYKATAGLPEEEKDGLVKMMREAAIAVPASIADGFRRRNMRMKLKMYSKAQAALEKLRYYVILCRDLQYPINHEELGYQGDQAARMINGLVRSIATRRPGR